MKSRKPKATSPSVPSTRATIVSGSWRESMATRKAHQESIRIHSSSEPSWPPQTPATRYCSGSSEFECWAT